MSRTLRRSHVVKAPRSNGGVSWTSGDVAFLALITNAPGISSAENGLWKSLLYPQASREFGLWISFGCPQIHVPGRGLFPPAAADEILEHMFDTQSLGGSAGAPFGFDVELAEGIPSLESIGLLLDHAAGAAGLPRDAAVAGAIGVEKAKRLLDWAGMLFQAAAAGTQPRHRDVDEAAQELSCALGMWPGSASTRIRASRNIVRRLPVTLKALEAADISRYQAEKVEHATRELDVADAQAVEAAAVPGSPRGLNERLARAVTRIAPEFAKKKTETQRAERSIENWSDPAEGIAGFSLQERWPTSR